MAATAWASAICISQAPATLCLHLLANANGSRQSQMWGQPAGAGAGISLGFSNALQLSAKRERRAAAVSRRVSAGGRPSGGANCSKEGDCNNSADNPTGVSEPRKDAVQEVVGGAPAPAGTSQRRQLLAMAAGAAAAAVTVGPAALGNKAVAEPINAPDVNLCRKAYYTKGGPAAVDPPPQYVQCCPPFDAATVKIVDFTLPSRSEPLRVRKAAHLLTEKEKAAYARAYEKIRALPDDHPHSLTAQANVHCAYCNYGYVQQDGETELQVHASWLFLPFHRWYLYFHERILAKYAGVPDLTLPFWNWDNQSATEYPVPNEIPAVFLDPRYPSLSNAIRNTDHFPPNLVDFTRGNVPQSEPQRLRDCNTALLWQNLVDGARTPQLFFGGAYRAGDKKTPGGGTLESLPHGPPHGWTGGDVKDPRSPAGEDMGNFYSAGRDPIFYSHHSNVDRMWTVWRTLPGRGGRPGRPNPRDPDFLNSSFLFYDEEERLVRVYVRDCLDTTTLRYEFAAAPDAWKDYDIGARVAATRRGPRQGPGPRERGRRREIVDVAAGAGPDGRRRGDRFKIDVSTAEGSTFRVGRPEGRRRGRRGGRRGGDDDDDEEVLVLKGVTVPVNKTVSFDIFLNLDEEDTKPDACSPNYVGSYYNVAHSAPGGASERVTNLRVGIGSKLDLLGITDVSQLDITIVERDAVAGTSKRITIESFEIEGDKGTL